MANPSPSNQVANLLGTGGGNKANLTSFKPGERRVGRQVGTPNRLPELMLGLFEAAAELGYMRQALVVDKDGNPEVGSDGVPTGRMAWTPSGEEGFKGYLKWLGINNSTAFVALIKSMIPHQVNLRTEKIPDIRYRTFAEVKADLKAVGYSDEKIEMLVEDLRPKKVIAVNAESKTPAETPTKTPAAAGGQGDYLDEDGILRDAEGSRK